MKKLSEMLSKININKHGENNFLIIAGPCVIESLEMCLEIAETMRDLCNELGFSYVFKASYDKANRSSISSYRGPGIDKGLEILNTVKEKIKVPVLSDIHLPQEAEKAKNVLDILQVPAFLARQTDLLVAAAKTNKIVNVKKPQFFSPFEMKNIVEKLEVSGNDNIFLTERGTFFGYNELVNDFRSLYIMKQMAPVIYDVTHSVQTPGSKGNSSGGNIQYAASLMRSAVASGISGLFIETHPEPKKALSDSGSQMPLSEMRNILEQAKEINNTLKKLNIDY